MTDEQGKPAAPDDKRDKPAYYVGYQGLGNPAPLVYNVPSGSSAFPSPTGTLWHSQYAQQSAANTVNFRTDDNPKVTDAQLELSRQMVTNYHTEAMKSLDIQEKQTNGILGLLQKRDRTDGFVMLGGGIFALLTVAGGVLLILYGKETPGLSMVTGGVSLVAGFLSGQGVRRRDVNQG